MYIPEYKTPLQVRLPLFSLPPHPSSQSSISRKLLVHNTLNCTHKYNVTLQFSEDESGTKSHLIFKKIQDVLKFQRNLCPPWRWRQQFLQSVTTYLPDYTVPHLSRLHSQCCEHLETHKPTHICFIHNYILTIDSMSATLIPDRQCMIQLPTVTHALPVWQPCPFLVATEFFYQSLRSV